MKNTLWISILFTLLNQSPIIYGKNSSIPWKTWVNVHHKTSEKNSKLLENGIILWQNSEFSLTLDENADLKSIRALLQQRPAYVANLAYNSDATRLIESMQETEIFIPPTPERKGLALFTPASSLQLNNVASLIHAQDGFSCGNIQILTGIPRLTSDTQNIGPILQNYVENNQVRSMMQDVSEENLHDTIAALSALPTRGHTTLVGIQDVPELIKKMFSDAADTLDLNVISSPLVLGGSDQPNVVATLNGTEDNDTAVIIGAHMDTILGHNPNGNAPGSDDDASGIATMVELVRILAKNQITFKRRVEFHAYSAEEVGLIGSSDLASNYAAENKKVAGMLQIDMDSFSHSDTDSKIYLISTSTTPELILSLKSYLHTYLAGNYSLLPLTAGSSDHKAWYDNSYPAAFIFEHPQNYNKALHTIKDTVDVSHRFDITSRFAQLSLAFLAHYAGINQGTSAVPTTDKNLKVALFPSSVQEEAWDLAISGSAAIQSVEVCKSSSATDKACVAYPLSPKFSHAAESGRRFFINPADEPLALSAGLELTLWGYDKNKKLVSVRHVALATK